MYTQIYHIFNLFAQFFLLSSKPKPAGMPYTSQERIKIVEFYLLTNSFVSTQRRFRLHFNVRNGPTNKTIKNLVENFRRKGSILNLNRGASGRPVSVRSEENIETVRVSVFEDRNKSYRKRAQTLLMKPSSLLTILKKDLKLTPYKMHNVQQLSMADKTARMEMCLRFHEIMDNDDDWIKNVWFSDEAHFHLNGNVNSQNCRTWSNEPPDEVNERPLHSAKCTAWCAISAHGVIGPLWFQDRGTTVTITQERYRRILDSFYGLLQRRQDLRFESQWFQQDGATPHTANETMRKLEEMFGGRIISKRSDFPWSPRSPDLSPLDFFIWGYCKENVYSNAPQSVPELQRSIEDFIHNIPSATCERVIANFKRRINECINRRGDHIEHRI